MTKIKLVQRIGSEVCEDCGNGSDCGVDPEECDRIENAVTLLTEFGKCTKDPEKCSSIPPGYCGPDCHGFENK